MLFSCQKNDIVENFKSEISKNDINCLKEISRAEADIKNNKDVYCSSFGFLSFNANESRHEEQFDSILNSLNITHKTVVYSDLVFEDRRENCYCELMNISFEQKFGKDFISKIHHKADSIWILKNDNLVFSNGGVNGSWDKPALYPNDKYYNSEYHSGLQEEFDKIITYPENYIKTGTGDGLAQLRVDVSVNKIGEVKILDYYFTFFDTNKNIENYNQEHWESIKNVAFEAITKNKWKPATIGNIDVNSEFSVFIKLK